MSADLGELAEFRRRRRHKGSTRRKISQSLKRFFRTGSPGATLLYSGIGAAGLVGLGMTLKGSKGSVNSKSAGEIKQERLGQQQRRKEKYARDKARADAISTKNQELKKTSRILSKDEIFDNLGYVPPERPKPWQFPKKLTPDEFRKAAHDVLDQDSHGRYMVDMARRSANVGGDILGEAKEWVKQDRALREKLKKYRGY